MIVSFWIEHYIMHAHAIHVNQRANVQYSGIIEISAQQNQNLICYWIEQ